MQADTPSKKKAKAKLMYHSKYIKEQLSYKDNIHCLIESLSSGVDLNVDMSRAKFEDICKPVFDRIYKPLEDVLENAGLQKSQIDTVVTVGGSTRIPWVKQMLTNFFEKDVYDKLDKDKAVAQGAILLANEMRQNNKLPI